MSESRYSKNELAELQAVPQPLPRIAVSRALSPARPGRRTENTSDNALTGRIERTPAQNSGSGSLDRFIDSLGYSHGDLADPGIEQLVLEGDLLEPTSRVRALDHDLHAAVRHVMDKDCLDYATTNKIPVVRDARDARDIRDTRDLLDHATTNKIARVRESIDLTTRTSKLQLGKDLTYITEKLEIGETERRNSSGSFTVPAPLPPSPAGLSGPTPWLTHTQMPAGSIPDLGELAPESTLSSFSGPHLAPEVFVPEQAQAPEDRTLRRSWLIDLESRPWLLPVLLAVTCLAVGMVLGALVFGRPGAMARSQGALDCQTPAATDLGSS